MFAVPQRACTVDCAVDGALHALTLGQSADPCQLTPAMASRLGGCNADTNAAPCSPNDSLCTRRVPAPLAASTETRSQPAHLFFAAGLLLLLLLLLHQSTAKCSRSVLPPAVGQHSWQKKLAALVTFRIAIPEATTGCSIECAGQC